MILGYEQPIDIPILSIYDKPMMQMYLQALLKDYEQGVAEQKEFLSNFGNFTSPIAADIDAWNARTIDPIREYLDRNPNALRSVEGRNLISKFIATRPYGDLAKLRLNAENVKQYKLALAAGIANGTLDAATAMELDGDFSNWNTLQNGMWDKLAPTSQKTINEVLAPYILDLNKYGYEYDEAASKAKGDGWYVKTVSDLAIKDELNKNAIDIMKDPMMQLRAKKLGMTPEEFIERELYTHMRRELTPQEDQDKVYFANEGLKNDRARLALERDKFNLDKAKIAAEIDAAKAKAAKDRAAASGAGKDGSYSYNYTSFNSAIEQRGFSGYVTQDGRYVSPSEHEEIAKSDYIYNKIKNTNVFIKNKNTGKYETVKFGSLNDKLKLELVTRDGSKIRQQYLSAERQFYQDTQKRLINNYIKKGGNYRTSSLAMASHDDANQWMSDIHPSQYVYWDENKSKMKGVDATSDDVKNNLFTIGEVSARTGQHGKGFAKRRYSENNQKRQDVAYFRAVNEGNSAGQIYQWEAYDGKYHRYRKVNTYSEDDTFLGEMWIECMDPTDINSSRGQGWDNRAVKGAGGSTKAIPSALDTVSLDEDNIQS